MQHTCTETQREAEHEGEHGQHGNDSLHALLHRTHQHDGEQQQGAEPVRIRTKKSIIRGITTRLKVIHFEDEQSTTNK